MYKRQGDSFNYSPPRQDLEIFSINSEFDYQITGSSLYQKTTINYKMDIPADLQERAKQQTSIKSVSYTHLDVYKRQVFI